MVKGERKYGERTAVFIKYHKWEEGVEGKGRDRSMYIFQYCTSGQQAGVEENREEWRKIERNGGK